MDDFTVLEGFRAYQSLQSSQGFQERYLPELKWLGYYDIVDDFLERNRMAMVLTHPGSGKSTLVSYIRTLKKIAADRSTRIGYFSKTAAKAKNFMLSTGRELRTNDMLTVDFGKFYDRWDPNIIWNTEQIRVVGSDHSKATPTLINLGQATQFESLRFDGLILDDPIDIKTALSATETARMDKILGSLIDRLDPGGWLVIIGRRHLSNDFYQLVTETRPYIETLILPAVHIPRNRFVPQPYDDIENGVVLVPELWVDNRIFEEKWGRLKKWEWQTGFQQIRTTPEDSTFGMIPKQYVKLEDAPQSMILFSASDPAYSHGELADWSVVIVGGKYKDGILITAIQDWQISSGWSSRFVEFARNNGACQLLVEINNAQTLGEEMREYVRNNNRGIQVTDLRSKGKKEFRIGELAGEAERGRVYFLESLIQKAAFQRLIYEWDNYPNCLTDDHLDCLEMLWSLVYPTEEPMRANVRSLTW